MTDSTEDINIDIRTFFDELTPNDLEILLRRKRYEMRRTEILKNYSIKQLPEPDGRFWIRIDGKQYFRKSREELEDLILKLNTVSEQTIVNIFPAYMEQRKQEVAMTTWATDMRYYKLHIKDSGLANKPLSKITIADGYDFFSYMQNKCKDMKEKYWLNVKSSLDMIFKYCVQKGYIVYNPIENMAIHHSKFAPKKETAEEDTVFSKEEQKKVCDMAELDAEMTRSAIPLGIPFLFNTGLRDGEIIASKWCDIVDIGGQKHMYIRRIQVGSVNEDGMIRGRETADRCKSKRSKRKVPLNRKCLELLDKIKEYNIENGFPTDEDDYIFYRLYKGEICECTERSFAGRLKKYCKNLGMISKSPHDIRRTALTNLWLQGVPIKIIQMIAGHNSQKQTEDYLRISERDILGNAYMERLCDTHVEGFGDPYKGQQKIVQFRKRA